MERVFPHWSARTCTAREVHATFGAPIVGEILRPDEVAWVRHHHERPDGRGHPDGVAGDAIADGAAVLAVADAFDVMTAARPYSARKPVREAIAEILGLAGRISRRPSRRRSPR